MLRQSEDIIENINKNIIDTSVNPIDAKNKIAEILRTSKTDKKNKNLGTKSEFLSMARIVLSEEFGVKSQDIIYSVCEITDGSLAELCLIGDGKFRINIDKTMFENSSLITFMVNVCHEFGHVKQVCEEIKGKNVPRGLEIDWQKLNLESKAWEIVGTNILYLNNKNEQQATKQAFSSLEKWLYYSRKKGNPTSALFSNRHAIITEKNKEKLAKLLGCWLAIWWNTANLIVRGGKDYRPVNYSKLSDAFYQKIYDEKE